MSIIPGLVLGAAYWFLSKTPSLPESVDDAISLAPYVLFFVAACLGWFFNRGKIVHIMLVLALAYGAVLYLNPDGPIVSETNRALFALVSFLLPLNFLAVVLQKQQRQVLTLRGLTFLALLGMEVFVVIWLFDRYPAELSAFALFPYSIGVDLSAWTHLSLPAIIASALAIVTSLFRVVYRFSLIEAGNFWALLGSIIAMHAGGQHPEFAIFFTLATLILTMTLLQTWYDIAYLDQLTALPGRLALKEMVKNLRGRYVVAMVDVDFFKKCNDTYGHDVGDQILKLVASKLRNVTGGGTAFRYGGEEFTVLFPNKRIKEVFTHLSTLRETIEETHMILRNNPRPDKRPNPVPKRKQPLRYINVTVSIGIAERNEEHDDPASVFKAADEALYRAKDRGRNRLSF
jgi:diguanylate cyclase (GGDEF)-like protein